MFELFVFGTFWFWGLIVLEIVLLFAFIENDKGFLATVSCLFTMCLLQWGGDVDIIGYVRHNPLKIVCFGLIYLACGAVWGVIKWKIHCNKMLRLYNNFKHDFLSDHNVENTSVVPTDLKLEFKSKLSSHNNYKSRDKIGTAPQVAAYKEDIIRWMAFWVISMAWSFIADFVKECFEYIYTNLSTFLQGLSNTTFSNIDEDIK